MKISVNNGRELEIYQNQPDGVIRVETWNRSALEKTEIISAGDMVTMLNWYRYQKTHGNTNLEF